MLTQRPGLPVCFHRRRPFLIRPLENTLVKLILSLEFYSQEGRQKIAIGAHLPRFLMCSAPVPVYAGHQSTRQRKPCLPSLQPRVAQDQRLRASFSAFPVSSCTMGKMS